MDPTPRGPLARPPQAQVIANVGLTGRAIHPVVEPMQVPSRCWVFVGLLAFLVAPGCALRRPTLSRSHEAAFGMGGVGHMLTGSEYSEEDSRYGAGAAMALRGSYARCLDKGEGAVCFEIPVDGIPNEDYEPEPCSSPELLYARVDTRPPVRIQRTSRGILATQFHRHRHWRRSLRLERHTARWGNSRETAIDDGQRSRGSRTQCAIAGSAGPSYRSLRRRR